MAENAQISRGDLDFEFRDAVQIKDPTNLRIAEFPSPVV
jgi:hypothetical protein